MKILVTNLKSILNFQISLQTVEPAAVCQIKKPTTEQSPEVAREITIWGRKRAL